MICIVNPTFLSIVIPAHNEETRLPRTLGKIYDFLKDQPYAYEVLIIENGSSDRTLELAQAFCSTHAGFTSYQELKSGKGNAVQQGMLKARGQYRFICDADLSMPIEEIQKFLPPVLSHFDVAIGSREAPGAIRYNEPFYRHMGGRAINLAIRLLILPGLHDTQCGFKCFNADSAEIIFRRQTIRGWSFDIENLYIARQKNLKIKEIPIHWYYDPDSKVNAIRDALRMIGDIFRIHINSLRGKYDLSS